MSYPPAEDLFGSTTMALMADVLALLVAVANVVAARIEDGETGQRDGQRRR
jgi:hypothetical protein